jgi:hypothetical protein
MYIRKVTQKNSKTGRQYHTYRLVETYRNIEGKVRQKVLLNLGTNFEASEDQKKMLADRIEEIVRGQQSLIAYDDEIEEKAQSIAKRVIHRVSENKEQISVSNQDYVTVDINTLEHQQIRQIGAEHVGLEIAKQLQLDKLFSELKFNKKQINTALSSIIGRLVAPGSERSTHKYLQTQSALDELLGCDFQQLTLNQLYQISDKLESNKDTIESALFRREKDLFNLDETVTLYDLTNTYFEGRALSNEKAVYGRSKEKRSDCPLVTLGLVLDSSGFPKKSKVYEGNASEPKTLQKILESLEGKTKPTVVIDAGIASEENIEWLKTNGYNYIAVSKKANKMVIDEGVIIKHKKDYLIQSRFVKNEKTNECELYCSSELKLKKEESMRNQDSTRFEEGLEKILTGLNKKNTVKGFSEISERIGRLKEKYKRISYTYDVEVVPDEKNEKAITIKWKKIDNKQKQPGTYCLRSNRTDLDEQTFWNCVFQ